MLVAFAGIAREAVRSYVDTARTPDDETPSPQAEEALLMAGRRRAGRASRNFDERAFRQILQRALGQLGVGVAICDERLSVIVCTDLAQEIFERFVPRRFQLGHLVPAAIARAVTNPLPAEPRTSPSVRVETPDGRDAVYVSAMR